MMKQVLHIEEDLQQKIRLSLLDMKYPKKAHNALRWLVQKQGYTRDESAIVCWMINRDMPLPNVMKDSINGFTDMEDFDCDALLDDTEADNPDYDTGMHFAEQFRNAVNGYAGKIKTEDKVAIISLEAATTGRLSVVYYDEINGKQYMDAILNWQEHCKWRRTIKSWHIGMIQRRGLHWNVPHHQEIWHSPHLEYRNRNG